MQMPRIIDNAKPWNGIADMVQEHPLTTPPEPFGINERVDYLWDRVTALSAIATKGIVLKSPCDITRALLTLCNAAHAAHGNELLLMAAEQRPAAHGFDLGPLMLSLGAAVLTLEAA